MEKLFAEFSKKFPIIFTEEEILKKIKHSLECAEKHYKEDPDGNLHIEYICKAYKMLEAYLIELCVNPNDHTLE